MKSPTLHISNYVHIRAGVLMCNGEKIFESETNNISEFITEIYRKSGLNYPKFFKMDNLAKSSFLAASYLLKDISSEIKSQGEKVAIHISNSASSLDTDLKHMESIKNPSDYFPSPAVFVYTLPNIGIGEICIYHGIKGDNCFYVFEAFQAEFMKNQAENVFKKGRTEFFIGGWTELLENNLDIFLFLVENKEKGLPLEQELLKNLYSKI